MRTKVTVSRPGLPPLEAVAIGRKPTPSGVVYIEVLDNEGYGWAYPEEQVTEVVSETHGGRERGLPNCGVCGHPERQHTALSCADCHLIAANALARDAAFHVYTSKVSAP